MKFLLATLDRARKHLAVVCVVATLVVSLAAAAHAHTNAADDRNAAGHCLLCVVAHAPSLMTAAAALRPALPQARALIVAGSADHRSRLLIPDLFIRPPPSLT